MYFGEVFEKNQNFTEAFLCKRYFPDVTDAAFLLTLTNCVILDRIFRTCFHPEFGLYCAKYAYNNNNNNNVDLYSAYSYNALSALQYAQTNYQEIECNKFLVIQTLE